jgi:hypothetical protein
MKGCSAISTEARGASAGGGRNLDAGTLSAPGTIDAKTAETVFAAHFHNSTEDRIRDCLAGPLPFGRVEGRTGFYRNDFLVAESEGNAARGTGKRKVQFVWIVRTAIVLAGSADVFVEEKSKLK